MACPLMMKALVMVTVMVMMVPDLTAGSEDARSCEPLKEPLCQHPDIQYNMTVMPNMLNHTTQEQAGLAVLETLPWLSLSPRCRDSVRLLVCTVYFPLCTILDTPIPPCRELCEEARDACTAEIENLRDSWPKELECELLPAVGQLCIKPMSMTSSATSTARPPIIEARLTSTTASSTSTGASATSTGTPLTSAGAPWTSTRASTGRSSYATTTPSSFTAAPPTPTGSSWNPWLFQPLTTERPGSSTDSSTDPTPGIPAPLKPLLAKFLGRFDRLLQLKEENMVLEQRKTRLEIQLLEEQLRGR